MDVCTNYFSNASCQEIPNNNSAIVTANGKQCAPPVKGASQGHADAIQSPISFLQDKYRNIHTGSQSYRAMHIEMISLSVHAPFKLAKMNK